MYYTILQVVYDSRQTVYAVRSADNNFSTKANYDPLLNSTYRIP